MARVSGKLLLLQIVVILCCSSASAQYEDLQNAYDFSSSGSGAGEGTDPTLVDYEYDDYEYIFPYIPEEVDICRRYPLGIIITIYDNTVCTS